MPDMDELIPSERDEEIYAVWEAGKTLRTLAREFAGLGFIWRISA